MKIITTLLISLIVLTSCSNNGKEKNIKGIQLLYTNTISDKEADDFAEYLKNSEIANGEEKTIQLDKTGNTYKVRMVVKEEIKDEI